MSVTAELQLVPAKDVAKRIKEQTLIAGESFSIDKTWLPFHLVFRELPAPLNLAIRGDKAVLGKLEGGMFEIDEAQEEEEVDVYWAFASARLAKKIAPALVDYAEAQLFAAIKQHGWDCKKGDQRYYGLHFKTLQKVYARAASEGAAVQIFIS